MFQITNQVDAWNITSMAVRRLITTMVSTVLGRVSMVSVLAEYNVPSRNASQFAIEN